MCMWMCVYMFVYAHTRAGAHAQMYVSRLTYQKPKNISISASLVLGFQANANTTGFVTWVLGIELEPYGCETSFTYRLTLPTQLLPFYSRPILCHYCIQS